MYRWWVCVRRIPKAIKLFNQHSKKSRLSILIERQTIKLLYICSNFRCHSVHHMYSSPFAAAAQHLHPFELFYVATFITCFPWVLNTHCLTYWGWFIVAQSVSYEVHIGYDLPFMPHRWMPFYAGRVKQKWAKNPPNFPTQLLFELSSLFCEWAFCSFLRNFRSSGTWHVSWLFANS